MIFRPAKIFLAGLFSPNLIESIEMLRLLAPIDVAGRWTVGQGNGCLSKIDNYALDMLEKCATGVCRAV